MTKTFVLQHEHEWCGRNEVKFIGVYSSHDDAQAAISRLRDQPGFRDWPDGFSINEYEIGIDHWTEGFANMLNILIPSRTNAGAYHVAGSVWRLGDLYEITGIAAVDDANYGVPMFTVGDVVRCKEMAVPEYGDQVLVASDVVRQGPKQADEPETK